MSWGIPEEELEDVKPKKFELIPDKTKLNAMITGVKWDAYQGESFIKITWQIIEGNYKNRLVWQKLKVENKKEDSRRLAFRMYYDIDKICGGGAKKIQGKPATEQLALAWCNNIACIEIGEYKGHNFVQSVQVAEEDNDYSHDDSDMPF